MSSSSSLTEEQRRRMEDNRRRALELRQAAAAATKNVIASKSSTSTSTGKPQPPSTATMTVSTSKSMSTSTASASAPTPSGTSKPFENRSNTTWSNSTSTSTTGADRSDPSTISGTSFYPSLTKRPPNANANVSNASSNPSQPQPHVRPAKVISGTASLISRERFKVEMPYSAQAIAIFKSVGGAQYDPTTKTWNFPIVQHAALLSAMESLKPSVLLGGLPPYVLRVFKNASASLPEPDLSRIDPVLVRALMPFQKDGVIFGIRKGGRVLIADDMGLGKTIQALGIAHYYREEWPLLIVSPSSMRYRWRESIWDWLPSVPAGSILIMETSRDPFEGNQVVIISYDFLQKRRKDLAGFKVVIMDESHHLKNFKTARAQSALPLLQGCSRAILLSGTPALSRPMELFPQISAINRRLFTVTEYGARYCAAKKTNWGWDTNGSSNMPELNLLLEESVMIRRLKSDVLQQLPPKLRKLVVLNPKLMKLTSKGFTARAQAFREADRLKIPQGEKKKRLLEYYSESAIVKLPAVSAYIKDLLEDGRKFLVFAHHKTMMEGICQNLEDASVKYIRIDGNSTSEDRQYCVEQFQSVDDIRVAVLSIMAANSGITLTAAHLVIFAELYWNPGILTQAEDRAHRIGQEDSVVVEYLLAQGTSDDYLWPMVQAKLTVLNKAGLSKDNFLDSEAVGFMGSALLEEAEASTSSGSRVCSGSATATASGSTKVSSSQKKVMGDYFTKTEVAHPQPTPASDPDPGPTDDTVFDMSEEDDAILMQLTNDY